MNKSKAIISILSLFLLSGCSFDVHYGSSSVDFSNEDESSIEDSSIEEDSGSSSGTQSVFYKNSVPYFDVVDLNNDGGTVYINDHKIDDINISFLKGDSYIPYFTLEEYFGLFATYIGTDTVATVNVKGDIISWVIKVNNVTRVSSSIDLKNKQVTLRGSLDDVYTYESLDYSESSVFAGAAFDGYYIAPGSDTTYSYATTDYEIIKEDDYYFPLSFLEATYGLDTDLHLFYNYKKLFIYSDYDDFSSLRMRKSKISILSITPFSDMEDVVKNTSKVPLNVEIDNLNSLEMIFDNRYGLKNINDLYPLKDYLKSTDILDLFTSQSKEDLARATATLFKNLDDGHTASVGTNSPWFVNYSHYVGYGPHITNMVAVRSQLNQYRKQILGSNNPRTVFYSDDGSLAFFTLNSFNNLVMNAYDEDHNLRDDLYEFDDYFYLKHQLEEIVTHNDSSAIDVTDVVIDISTNGGGVVQSMMKMLSILSTSAVTTYWYDDVTGELDGYHASINSPCYGGMFNFYILTSDYSFSCGNYFPYILQKENIATVIGHTTGGGECIVGSGASLPIGVGFVMSSSTHLGYYDGNEFIGCEDGALVTSDREIEYSNYFDLEYLDTFVSSL